MKGKHKHSERGQLSKENWTLWPQEGNTWLNQLKITWQLTCSAELMFGV